jgi:hypothetical protein
VEINVPEMNQHHRRQYTRLHLAAENGEPLAFSLA